MYNIAAKSTEDKKINLQSTKKHDKELITVWIYKVVELYISRIIGADCICLFYP